VLFSGPRGTADATDILGFLVGSFDQFADARVIVESRQPSEAEVFLATLDHFVGADEIDDRSVELVGHRDPSGGYGDDAETDIAGRRVNRGDRRVEGFLACLGHLVGPDHTGASEGADPGLQGSGCLFVEAQGFELLRHFVPGLGEFVGEILPHEFPGTRVGEGVGVGGVAAAHVVAASVDVCEKSLDLFGGAFEDGGSFVWGFQCAESAIRMELTQS